MFFLRGQTKIFFMRDDMVHPGLLCNGGGIVAAPVVDDEVFDFVEALNGFGKISNSFSEMLIFVEARNLYDKFIHCEGL